MLVHLTPRILNRYSDINVELVDITIPDFNLRLIGGIDVVARRPYPNKCHYVACKKKGRKAINGILVKTSGNVRDFSVHTRWCFNAERVVKHTVNYSVLDNEFGCVTEETKAWFKYGQFKDRSPYPFGTSKNHAPIMEILFQGVDESRKGGAIDTFQDGWLIHRQQCIDVPSVEHERLFSDKSILERMPPEEHLFVAKPRL